MPGENPDLVQNKINIYISELGARTEAERDALELVVMNYVRAKRANAADVAAGTRVMNDVVNNFEDRQCLRCADLVGNLASSPAATIIALRSFSHGIDHLLGLVESLEEQLQTTFSFFPDQRVLAIHLSGRNPKSLFTDRVVMDWNLFYLSGLRGPGKISAREAAALLADDRPDGMDPELFERRLEGFLGDGVAIEEGKAQLLESLAEVKAGLLERLAEVQEREAIDRELALQAATVSVNDECMKYARYRRESERGNQAAMRQFHQLQMMRLKYGDRIGGAAQEAPEPPAPMASDPRPEPEVPKGVETPSQPASQAVHRSEAGAAQVVDGPVGNSEPRMFSTVDFTIGRADNAAGRMTDGVTPPDRPRQGSSEVLRE
jgi:hypothetical protein